MLMLAVIPQDGRSEQFEGLVNRYEKRIFNLIYRLVGDYDEAADLTQDTFVAAFKSIDDFREDAGAYTWLYRIAVNKCKNRFKSEDRRREFEGETIDGCAVDLLAADDAANTVLSTPHTEIERKELKRLIEEAISRLPDDYRIVAVLRDLQGLSYQDIAETTGLGLDVVKTRLARARGMLRQKLEPYLKG